MKSDEDVKKIKPFTVVTVIGKVKPPEPKPENFAVDYAKSRHIHEQLTQVALALRTAFFNPNFVPMIEVSSFFQFFVSRLRNERKKE